MKIILSFFLIVNASILFGQAFTEITSIELEGVRSGASEMADVNGDGYLDILIIGDDINTAYVAKLYLNDGSGGFIESSNSGIVGLDRGDITFGDVDNDGDYDLIAAGITPSNSRICRLFINDGAGNFSFEMEGDFNPIQNCRLALEDVDNDQDLDLLVTGREPNFEPTMALYINDGSGSFTESDSTDLMLVTGGRPAFSDVDLDGDKDLIVSGLTDTWSYTNLYINDGQGTFTNESGEVPFTRAYYNSVEVGDIDGDGDEDLFLADNNDSYLYMNDGNGSFQEVVGTPFDRIRSGYAKFGDIDGDNDVDIMMVGENQDSLIAKLYLNDGTGNFEEVFDTPLEGTVQGDLTLGDIDNDGDLDVLIVGENENDDLTSKVYRNDIISGIYELGENNYCDFSITPNPIVDGVLVAKHSCDISKNTKVSIFNSAGNSFEHEVLNRASKNASIEIDVSNLGTGLYFLQLETAKGSIVQRFFVSP